ncbi:MAG: hypothetical protein K0U12_06725 [Gammaproteobacteria bacterium]|nr:hypothetical protein [Gammaproteobacteria bacterium]
MKSNNTTPPKKAEAQIVSPESTVVDSENSITETEGAIIESKETSTETAETDCFCKCSCATKISNCLASLFGCTSEGSGDANGNSICSWKSKKQTEKITIKYAGQEPLEGSTPAPQKI